MVHWLCALCSNKLMVPFVYHLDDTGFRIEKVLVCISDDLVQPCCLLCLPLLLECGSVQVTMFDVSRSDDVTQCWLFVFGLLRV